MEYDLIICFETHVELNTKTKLFCDCLVSYDAPPNSHICPVCTGQPGALPVLNRKAMEFTIKAGLALNCTINRLSRFARKNYFYPDLPKGYQISQYERPFCENGHLEIIGDDGQKYAVGIKRIHLEEDAGKLVHSSDSLGASQFSLVDYNRSSVPLLEIVNDHQNNPIRSITEARVYLEKLRQVLRYIEISECMLERGQFRCDVNISVRPRGSLQLGNRAEIKNMSSYKFIMDALEYEMNRQIDILESGGSVDQETRLFDEVKGITLPMRSKEDAPDYRYFPDPDLLEVTIDQELINKIRKEMPELPDQQMEMIIRDFGIAKNDAMILTRDKAVSDYFRLCASVCEDKKRLANWIIKELFKLLNEASFTIDRCLIIPDHFARLINLISSGEITDSIGRTVLLEMFKTGNDPETIIEEKGLKTISDDKLLKAILEEILAKNLEAVKQIKAGESRPVDFIMGKVMKKTKGKADPKKIKKLIREKLAE
jgi:aspartyl-tRNA(Asn)/glutamyl-tRNA(Gln) amidotransferase subunit B